MPQQKTRLEYDSLPAIVPSYLRAATTLSGGLSQGETIPEIVAELPDVDIRSQALARYRKVCGFRRAPQLPVTYPHVLAFPMQMAVMTHKQFPLKLLGLIHVRNEITQHRAIATNEKLHLDVAVGGHRDVARGIEFDLITRVRDRAGDLIWEESGTMLSRGHSKASGASDGESDSEENKNEDNKNPDKGAPFTPAHTGAWRIPADVGRRYALAAGDYNPIHLSPWSAKLFGFPRAIATGMWLKARAAAGLDPELSGAAYTLAITFKKPVFLPSDATFGYTLSEAGADFFVANAKGDTLHLLGDVRYR